MRQLTIYTHAALLPRDQLPAGPLLLLEGAWPGELVVSAQPEGQPGPPIVLLTLDETIDAQFAWIDRHASRLTEKLLEQLALKPGLNDRLRVWQPDRIELPGGELLPARTNQFQVLSLRYYFVKLLRLIAYFQHSQPLAPLSSVTLHAQRERDEDYVAVLESICHARAGSLQVVWLPAADITPAARAPSATWRRQLAQLNQFCRKMPRRQRLGAESSHALLCGQPAVLDPVCHELVRQNWSAAWVWDRFNVAHARKFQWRGVAQVNLLSEMGTADRFQPSLQLERLVCQGIDLAPAVEPFLARFRQQHGAALSRQWEGIAEEFERCRPAVVVLDEDVTPLARVILAIAKQQRVPTLVVQHGAPCVSFGFAPLAAERICVWGEAARDTLREFGVPPGQIVVTGSPSQARLAQQATKSRPSPKNSDFRLLVLANVPPRDERPDAVEYHLCSATHQGMWQAILAAVDKQHDIQLTIKLHPRTTSDADLMTMLESYPQVRFEIVRHGTLADLFRRSDAVISCASSAGIEATLFGLPVIQILPEGSAELLPVSRWGLFANVRTADELTRELILARATAREDLPVPSEAVFGHLGGNPAQRIVAAMNDLKEQSQTVLQPAVLPLHRRTS